MILSTRKLDLNKKGLTKNLIKNLIKDQKQFKVINYTYITNLCASWS